MTFITAAKGTFLLISRKLNLSFSSSGNLVEKEKINRGAARGMNSRNMDQ
ncbi:MAG: hypothetical protein ACP5G5_07685 [Thermoplasmata archaeon]|jgi:hypothetical protein